MIRYLLILILLLKQQNNIQKKREICIVNKGINTLKNCSIEEKSRGGQARGNIGGYFPSNLVFSWPIVYCYYIYMYIHIYILNNTCDSIEDFYSQYTIFLYIKMLKI